MIAARAWLGEQIALRNKGTLIDPSRETLGSWIKDYLEASQARVSAKTMQDYRYHLEKVVMPDLGRLTLRDITPRVVQTWIARMSRSKPAHTVWRAHKYLSLVLREAERLELIARNPASKVTVTKPPRAKMARWSTEDVTKALEYCQKKDVWLAAYIHLALVTGMRREELLGLRWSAVSLEHRNPHLEVREVCTYVRSHPHFEPPKTKQTRRVYLDAETVRVLERHFEYVENMRYKAKHLWKDMNLVFPATRGGPQPESNFTRHWRAMCDAAKVTPIRVYDLRSTYASLTEGKISETAAADRAGHSEEIRRTHYLRAVDDQRIAAALSLAELLK